MKLVASSNCASCHNNRSIMDLAAQKGSQFNWQNFLRHPQPPQRVAFELPQRILWQLLDDFVLVSEEEIRQAVSHYIEKAHALAEGAGAASLAAALKLRGRLSPEPIALVLSGGNVTIEEVRKSIEPCF